jgi:hypothetical protein
VDTKYKTYQARIYGDFALLYHRAKILYTMMDAPPMVCRLMFNIISFEGLMFCVSLSQTTPSVEEHSLLMRICDGSAMCVLVNQ